jgi:hypothetical protein
MGCNGGFQLHIRKVITGKVLVIQTGENPGFTAILS